MEPGDPLRCHVSAVAIPPPTCFTLFIEDGTSVEVPIHSVDSADPSEGLDTTMSVTYASWEQHFDCFPLTCVFVHYLGCANFYLL